MFAGVLTGSLVSVLVQPFDVVRTRMQADAASQALKATLTTACNIVATDGPRWVRLQATDLSTQAPVLVLIWP